MAWEWVGPVTTCVVGVAGVAGTVWTAGRSRTAQLEAMRIQGESQRTHALTAEKRVIYAKYLRCAEMSIDSTDRLKRLVEKLQNLKSNPSETQESEELVQLRKLAEAEHEQSDSHDRELAALRAEIAVIGGPLIGSLASQTNSALHGYFVSGDFSEINAYLSRTVAVMHLDLDVSKPDRERIIERLIREAD
ncbi:hypothetical protein ACH495_13965 [Micromonospora sp. NPDC018662]|uniref:hypothetical protein n=1 Tax=Micromonospora sp. NPDC018662 TaxID=3364238 RepID=UPI0037B97CD0